MLRTIIILILCCSCSPIEATTNSLLVADWSQTRQIPDRTGIYETNFILGENPSKSDIDNYFAAAIALNTILHRTLPKKYLPYYQAGLIAVEVGAVANNYNIGLNVRF